MKKILSFTLLAVLAAALPFVTAADQAGTKPEKPARIAFGKKVDLADHVVPGKTTVFDFTSKYCGPCQAIAPRLDALHERRDDIVVVAVDINRPDVRGIDWRSPVARQYGIESVPQFKVFGPDGTLQAEGEAATELVLGWLDES